MSFDIKVLRLCDHRIFEQDVLLQPDQKTLPIPYPVGNGNIRLTYNLDADSQLPFRVVPRQTLFVDEDVTETFNGIYVQVTYPPIKKSVGDRATIVMADGVRVIPTDIDHGRGVLVLPNTVALDAEITVTYEQENPLGARYMNVVLDRVLRGTRNIYEASYTTIKAYCPKCLGTGTVVDWPLEPGGGIPVVEDEEKLAQDIVRYIETVLGSDPYRDWLGSRLRGLIGKKITSVPYVREIINNEVRGTLVKLINMQRQQAQYQSVTLNEALESLLLVDTQLDTEDPTLWRVKVRVRTLAGTEANVVAAFNTTLTRFAVGAP
jgi:hypothetical protein